MGLGLYMILCMIFFFAIFHNENELDGRMSLKYADTANVFNRKNEQRLLYILTFFFHHKSQSRRGTALKQSPPADALDSPKYWTMHWIWFLFMIGPAAADIFTWTTYYYDIPFTASFE